MRGLNGKTSVYVLSDSVGETADLVARAAISQFESSDTTTIRVPYVDDKTIVDEVIEKVIKANGLIVFTIVLPEIRHYLLDQCSQRDVPVYDVLSPLLHMLEEKIDAPPKNETGLLYTLDEDYFKKVEAIEFAVKYDDGRDPRGILRADVVLVGVSRTSKTPLSQYLAHKRLKVANVPLVPEVDPPEELYSIPPERVIGLKINPEKLNGVRVERLKALGLKEQANYATFERIEEELSYAQSVMNKIGCTVIDVSDRAVEETANLIYQSVHKK